MSSSQKTEQRPLYHRNPCICCGTTSDMYLKENNRFCDICIKGPVCYDCYKGEWLKPCVCANCKKVTLVEEVSSLKIDTKDDGKYVPRFYGPNIHPSCRTCGKKHAIASCDDCRDVYCDNCIKKCVKCEQTYCGWCDNWDENICERCGNPEFDERYEEGKYITFWNSNTIITIEDLGSF